MRTPWANWLAAFFLGSARERERERERERAGLLAPVTSSAAAACRGRTSAITAFAEFGITRYFHRGLGCLARRTPPSCHTSERDSCRRLPFAMTPRPRSPTHTYVYCAAPLFGYGPVRLRSPTSHRQRRRSLPSLAVLMEAGWEIGDRSSEIGDRGSEIGDRRSGIGLLRPYSHVDDEHCSLAVPRHSIDFLEGCTHCWASR